ncbi:hypothetical protein ACFPJ5_00760 [Salinirubrum litoreum]|uniref:C2H2-type domain-containing protein n=2 Tax=Salinirubrum litoreum TaxID=1126234 RepID=A0ABD5R617_9EURY
MRIHHAHSHDESLVRRDTFRCPTCDKQFQTKQGFSRHLSELHPSYWKRVQSDGMRLIPDWEHETPESPPEKE